MLYHEINKTNLVILYEAKLYKALLGISNVN